MDSETICPYTGLRSFSEEESLYFRGRDEHIASVIRQLEEKKFLMITGASGDGKSSLIFAGLIPQARAGFFKTTYANWNVASFRPERSPLSNMARAITTAMRLDGSAGVENELSHGFSSLTEIYKSSSSYIDQSDQSWITATEEQKLMGERNAGNLLIVVDQFEEFFTNPENFPNGVPSQDARLVLNILLETVKISLRDDLPIYVVFTMRSDYIGQCAAFRGLPEFIGFSQFFVPRLQRRELQQVIEEPAILSGNTISKRFVDRLIYDLEDTEDRLPILQHVLKEVWKAADSGRVEMDLIHYAMVGGMEGGKLPVESIEAFQRWKEQLPEHRKKYLETPGLSNVLDIHANRLYDEAADAYNQSHSVGISEKDAKLIIGITFACLTRIDENRAVRNRMTLEEITRIINIPAITTEVVDDVLQQFRAADNTLVRPFIEEGGQAKSLQPGTVLDITHEALIRNWKLLNKWASKEFDYYNTFIDFKKQLQRWIDNGKSSDYLLPIGPLTYFETWFNNCRPNEWWINRYNAQAGDGQERIQQSRLTLDESRGYLKTSARRLFIARSFMKHGARKITLTAGALVVLISFVFAGYSWWTHRNDVVLDNIVKDGKQLLLAREADNVMKADFIMVTDRLHPGFFNSLNEMVPDRQQQIEIALTIPELIFSKDKFSEADLLLRSLQLADSLIRTTPPPEFSNVKAVENYLNNINDLLNLQVNRNYFNSTDLLKKQIERNAHLLGKFVFEFFTNADPGAKWEKKSLNVAVAHILNLNGVSSDSLSLLADSISPFERSEAVTKKFDLLFPSSETIPVGFNQEIEHNGGYQILSDLYASLGKVPEVLRCMDTISKYHKQYDLNVNNSLNTSAYFLLYHHDESFLNFVNKYSKEIGVSRAAYLSALANQAGIFGSREIYRAIKHGNKNYNLILFSGSTLEKVFDAYRTAIVEDIQDPNERNFMLAIQAKHHGLTLSKKSIELRAKPDLEKITKLFDDAFGFYGKLPSEFLEEEIVQATGGLSLRRNLFFIDPDHRPVILPVFNFQFQRSSYGDAFFKYITSKKLWGSLYTTYDEYSLLNQWVGVTLSVKGITLPYNDINSSYQNYPGVDNSVILSIDSLIIHSGFEKELDNSWVRLRLIDHYLEQGDSARMLAQLGRVNYEKFTQGRRDFIETICLWSYATNIAKKLIVSGYSNHVSKFPRRFRASENRMASYAQLGIASYESGQSLRAAAYLDTISIEFARAAAVNEFTYRSFYDTRIGLVKLLTLMKQERGKKEVLDLTGSMGDQIIEGIAVQARTYAGMAEYYKAQSAIPDLANANNRLYFYSQILYQDIILKRTGVLDEWSEFDKGSASLLNFVFYANDFN